MGDTAIRKHQLTEALLMLTREYTGSGPNLSCVRDQLGIPVRSYPLGDKLFDPHTLYTRDVGGAANHYKRNLTEIDIAYFSLVQEIKNELNRITEQEERKELARLKEKYETKDDLYAPF
jgi:hypothetical protein